MADETWEMMPADMQNLRVQVSPKVLSLEDLCLANVVDMLRSHIQALKDPSKPSSSIVQPSCQQCQNQDPFKDLPPVLMSSLQQTIQEIGITNSPCVQLCLVSENTQTVPAGFVLWTKKDKEALMERIRDRGQNISELLIDLDGRETVSQDLLQSMLGRLAKLTSLNVGGPVLDNSILATIGSCCPELRKLTLSSLQITDEGLHYLYQSDLPRGSNDEVFGKCKNLNHLNVENCKQVTTDELVSLLSNLPGLVCLKHDSLYEAIAKFAQINEAQLKLQFFKIQVLSEELGSMLASVISKIPDVKELKIFNETPSIEDDFNEMPDEVNQGPSQEKFLITQFSQQLTILKLHVHNKNIDISVIGFHCRQLTELFWLADCTLDFKYKLLPSVHFNNLKKVDIQLYNPNSTFPNDAMKCILASPCLEIFYMLIKCQVSDDTLSWLIEEARAHGVVFSKLRDMRLRCDISTLRAKQIVCVAPKLKIFLVPRATFVSVKLFLQHHDLTHCQVGGI